MDENDYHKGIVSDYIKNFEEKLNLKFNPILYKTWSEIIEALKSNETDIVGAVQQTSARDSFFLFTDVFMDVPLVLIVQKNNDAILDSSYISQMKLSVVNSYTSTEFAYQKYPTANFLSHNDDLSSLLSTSFGTSEGTITDLMVASHIVEKYGISNLKIGKTLDYTWHLSFAIRKDMPELHSILDKTLGTISSSERNAIFQNWIVLKEIPSQSFIEKYYRSIEVVIISLILIAILLIRTTIFLKRQVRKKTLELTKELRENIKSKKTIEKNEARLESLLRISNYKAKSQNELLDFALNEAVELTNSKIGYLLFYNEKTQIFNLSNWSKTAMKEFEVKDKQTLYYLEKSGFWSEAVTQRKPVINNNFSDFHPLKKGQPQGHLTVSKLLAIPVFDEDEIIATVGVGNKEEDYDQSDIRQLSLLMNSVWKILSRQRWQEELLKAKEKAEENDNLKTAFLTNLSHEIRTPMNGIMGFASFFENEDLSQELAKKYSEIIIESTKQLLHIVSNIIDISIIQTVKIEPLLSSINMEQLLQEVYLMHQTISSSKNLDFTLSFNTKHNTHFISDETRIKQILNNLIDNAIKFTQNGFIKLGCNVKEKELEFYVQDSGIGIPEDVMDKIFERFRQAEISISRNYGGMGLGLSISKAYAELLGGNIQVTSEINKGSIFRCTIPYQKSESVKSIATQNIKLDFDFSNYSILIVEDEKYNLMYLVEILQPTGVDILSAKNAEDTLKTLKNKLPDLILMDIKLPTMNGIELTKIIKNQNFPIYQ